jgi:hypothetical protein
MNPPNGKWTGRFVTDDGKQVNVVLELAFSANGSISGTFAVTPPAGTNWHGPTRGRLSGGSYSPDGTLQMEENTDPGNFGSATLQGGYLAPSATAGSIWGRVLITKGGQQEGGNLNLVYIVPIEAALGHVWGE